MEAQPIHEEQESKSVTERFNELFKDGELKEICLDDVPPVARDYFEYCSERFNPPRYHVPNNFSGVYLLTHENGDHTYVAEQTKVYVESGKTELDTYFIEMRGGTRIGDGEIRKDTSASPEFDGNPFIGYTKTEEGLGGERLGERRLNFMNSFAQAQYGESLYSGRSLNPDSEGFFAQLESEGKVEIVKDPKGKKKPYYRMLPISPGQNLE